MATDPASGSSSHEPFAYFDPDSCSWRMCQGSLLEDSGESCTTWPRQVTWDRQFVWELPTSGPLTDESESSSLLPTPSAYESTPTDEFNEEVREHLLATHERLYLPGRKWHSQRTLSRMAGALLPTPSATQNDGHDPDKMLARREREKAKGRNGNGFGLTLGMATSLLPTPVVSDGRGLTDGDSRDGGPSLREVDALLPTPSAWLGRRPENATADPERAASEGKRSLELPDALALLPTPTARDHKGSGQHPERHMAQHRLTGIEHRDDPTRAPLLPTPVRGDADGSRSSKGSARPDEMGLAGTVKMLPTPTSQDARQNALNEAEAQRNPATMWATMGRVHHGDHTSPRFGGGRQSSPEPHPDQLTLEDA